MDRRHFLIKGSQTIGASLVGTMVLPGAGARAQSDADSNETRQYPDLVLAKGSPSDAVTKAISAIGGMSRFVKENDVVVIKPNASFATPPEWGATTHPEVLTSVVSLCLAAGARRVLVVDHTLKPAKHCFGRCGIAKAMEPIAKAKLISLDKQKGYRMVEIPGAQALKTTEIASSVLKADLFINLPTAKSHSATNVSFGLKNLMGLVWNRNTFHKEMDIHQGIAELATTLRAQLTILDAMHILQTGGPVGPGDVDSFGGVIAGTDPVAVDAYGVGLSTWNQQTYLPEQIKHLRYAHELGVGNIKLDSMNILELT